MHRKAKVVVIAGVAAVVAFVKLGDLSGPKPHNPPEESSTVRTVFEEPAKAPGTITPAPTPLKLPPAPTPSIVGTPVHEFYAQDMGSKAAGPCMRAIERSAKYDLRWTSSWGIPGLGRWNRLHRADGHMLFAGDDAEAQNGIGNWMRVTYFCEFDPAKGRVVDAGIQAGRLR